MYSQATKAAAAPTAQSADGGSGGAAAPAAAAVDGAGVVDVERGQQALALIAEGLTVLAGDADAVGKLLVALGTLLLAGGPVYAEAAASLELGAAAAAAAAAPTATPAVREAAADVATAMTKK
jgi:hypothetical protein